MFKKTDKAIFAAIITLAWPTMVEQLMQTAVQYIDTALVGSLGTQATAAVGSTSTVNWLMNGTVFAVGIGFLAYIAQTTGAGDYEKAKKAAGQAVMTVLTLGTFFTVLTVSLSTQIPIWMRADEEIRPLASRYFMITFAPMLFRTAIMVFGTVLRAAGDTKTPMRVGIIMNIINTVLNFLLIYATRTVDIFGTPVTVYGAGLGVDGAAIASAAAYVYGGISITAKLWRHDKVSPKGQSILPDIEILKPCMRIAVPNMLQRFGTSLGFVVFATMINSLGETATAAHTIANTVESAFYIPGWGMQTAAATLSGNAFGAGDDERLGKIGKTVIPLEFVIMMLSGGLLFLLAPNLMQLFSKDADVIALGTTVLRMVAVSEPFYGVSIVIEGIMQGVGQTVAPFVFNVLGMWCARIAGTFVCTQILGYGLVSAWACMIAHNLLIFALFTARYSMGNWKPKISALDKT